MKQGGNVMEKDIVYEEVPIYITLVVNAAHCMNI